MKYEIEIKSHCPKCNKNQFDNFGTTDIPKYKIIKCLECKGTLKVIEFKLKKINIVDGKSVISEELKYDTKTELTNQINIIKSI